ncbi:putative isochorismatase [Monocercomonoides exilis]|uniref:putative isochorismatase n=1 Tax=Monocercomonoides exilis TaxID=2049356 RepID=UPI00355A10C1|nr:putative isochorismatase [Monocercomonoides exilis]|eukprot:MONOS_12821.1-p1 / transcript=MONOS_12821.1 / gene=MONOS_12821 / organism=Monocercomonoides_exilis_PA203 / gene_product=isochorismatase / transcript_product=isochorismatase / location=Mono_scaffold00738:24108-24671(-) / protein_length=188 / sequence_SO=supercontig / SO=protein_coding / is_pseudo=false
MEDSRKGLVIVDIQNDYFQGGRNPLSNQESAAVNALKVLNEFRKAKLPVFIIQHINEDPASRFFIKNTEGVKLHEGLEPREGEQHIVKHVPSSFVGTTLLEELKKENISEVVVIGSMSNMCIDSTARDSVHLGFKTTVIHDCCAAMDLCFGETKIPSPTVHATFMAALAMLAQVTDTETFLKTIQKC